MDELIKFCAESTSLNESAIVAVFDSLRIFIGREIRNGFDVRIDKLGTFKGKVAPAYVSRNPRTGEPVNVPEKKRVNLKFAKAFINLIQPLENNQEGDEEIDEAYKSKESLAVSFPYETVANTPINTPITNAMMLANTPTVRNWYVALPGRTIELSEHNLISNGTDKDTLVWREGMSGWEYAGNVAELKYLFPNPFPPLPV